MASKIQNGNWRIQNNDSKIQNGNWRIQNKDKCKDKNDLDTESYCLLCQEYGHNISEKCSTCLNCGVKGHFRKDCRLDQTKEKVHIKSENIEKDFEFDKNVNEGYYFINPYYEDKIETDSDVTYERKIKKEWESDTQYGKDCCNNDETAKLSEIKTKEESKCIEQHLVKCEVPQPNIKYKEDQVKIVSTATGPNIIQYSKTSSPISTSVLVPTAKTASISGRLGQGTKKEFQVSSSHGIIKTRKIGIGKHKTLKETSSKRVSFGEDVRNMDTGELYIKRRSKSHSNIQELENKHWYKVTKREGQNYIDRIRRRSDEEERGRRMILDDNRYEREEGGRGNVFQRLGGKKRY